MLPLFQDIISFFIEFGMIGNFFVIHFSNPEILILKLKVKIIREKSANLFILLL